MAEIDALTVDDMGQAASLGLDKATALRALSQNMAWAARQQAKVYAVATAYLADGTVFVDQLLGSHCGRGALLDHIIAYARWSDAPAVTLPDQPLEPSLRDRGFIQLRREGLPTALANAAQRQVLVCKRI